MSRTSLQLACTRCALIKQDGFIPVTLMRDPGCRTFSNGDPGYPGSDELELGTCNSCGAEDWSDLEYDGFLETAISKVETMEDEEMSQWEAERQQEEDVAAERLDLEAFDDDPFNDIDQGRWDDDPNPYDGTYSEE